MEVARYRDDDDAGAAVIDGAVLLPMMHLRNQHCFQLDG
jgi:hypothetical protein